jgi:hypothetical protein
LRSMRLGNEWTWKVKAQHACCMTRLTSYTESVEDFALRLTGMVTQLGALGEPVTEDLAVRKFLCTAP